MENEGKRKGNKEKLMENELNDARKWQKLIGKEGKRKGNKEKQREHEGKRKKMKKNQWHFFTAKKTKTKQQPKKNHRPLTLIYPRDLVMVSHMLWMNGLLIELPTSEHDETTFNECFCLVYHIMQVSFPNWNHHEYS